MSNRCNCPSIVRTPLTRSSYEPRLHGGRVSRGAIASSVASRICPSKTFAPVMIAALCMQPLEHTRLAPLMARRPGTQLVGQPLPLAAATQLVQDARQHHAIG